MEAQKINKYYVYEWFIVETKEVFYVGKGSGDRYKNIYQRNKFFKDMYNTHNCDTRIVLDNLSEEEAFEKEIELIGYYRENTDYRLTNMTDGGEGTSGWIPSDEFKIKQSKIHKEQWNDINYREKMLKIRNSENSPYKTTEFREKISNIVSGKNNPNYNNRWSDEQKEHLSIVRKELKIAAGNNNPNCKKIICLETGEVFSTIKDAQMKYDVKSETSFSVALKNKQKTAAGLHWRYFDESLLVEDYRFKELLFSLEASNKYPIICVENKKIYCNRRKFLREHNYGIKRFKKEYSENNKIIIDDLHYMYIKDYLSRYM